jgi:arsenate reductase
MTIQLLPGLSATIQALDPDSISEERKDVLHVLVEYITRKIVQNQEVNLNFICTHNSRRSQFAQVWAKVAADHTGIPINSYSGGVEVTACNERTVEALRQAGFTVDSSEGENPVYKVEYGGEPIRLFSKLFDDAENNANTFAAVMTCGHADANCPFIPGMEQRISLTYDDPKEFDGTELEAGMYMERSNQIARELIYVFKQVNNRVNDK